MTTHSDGWLAQSNFVNLGNNSYPGRIIVAGLDESGRHLVQVYCITGRHENSRNRVCSMDGGRVFTEAADPKKVTDPSLIFYDAMLEWGGSYVVSNGDQTGVFMRHIKAAIPLEVPWFLCSYEPDPNDTQRVTAVCSLKGGPLLEMFIHRKSLFGQGCDHTRYAYGELAAGFGFSISTYAGNGNPLPPFRGDPLVMPLTGSIEEIAQAYWAALDEENRVSLVVKMIDRANGKSTVRIINKYEKVPVR